MTEEQIKQFPTNAEEYFYKQSKDGTPWKKEIYNFFEVINFYRKAIKELQKRVKNLQKYLDTRNCYRECAETWEKLTESKEIIREILSRPDGEISYETRAKAEAFIKEHKE